MAKLIDADKFVAKIYNHINDVGSYTRNFTKSEIDSIVSDMPDEGKFKDKVIRAMAKSHSCPPDAYKQVCFPHIGKRVRHNSSICIECLIEYFTKQVEANDAQPNCTVIDDPQTTEGTGDFREIL